VGNDIGLPQMSGYTPADASIAALLKIRISDGAILDRWDLPPTNLGHTLGDLAIGPRGDVFVSDSRDPVLYRMRPAARSLERITHPLFRSLRGIAPTPDGTALDVADYSHGVLRADLRTATVTRLTDARESTTLGLDGLTWYRSTRIGMQNGVSPARVIRLWLDTSRLRVTRQEVLDRNPTLEDEPTIGTLAGDTFVCVANSQWDKHDEAGVRLLNTSLSGTRLLSISLRR
jgi:hypothetical protein